MFAVNFNWISTWYFMRLFHLVLRIDKLLFSVCWMEKNLINMTMVGGEVKLNKNFLSRTHKFPLLIYSFLNNKFEWYFLSMNYYRCSKGKLIKEKFNVVHFCQLSVMMPKNEKIRGNKFNPTCNLTCFLNYHYIAPFIDPSTVHVSEFFHSYLPFLLKWHADADDDDLMESSHASCKVNLKHWLTLASRV